VFGVERLPRRSQAKAGWTFSFSLESEGCLVVLAVFKTVVGSQEPGQVRFLSSPPFDFGFSIADFRLQRIGVDRFPFQNRNSKLENVERR
jgi:hypothetical protein